MALGALGQFLTRTEWWVSTSNRVSTATAAYCPRRRVRRLAGLVLLLVGAICCAAPSWPELPGWQTVLGSPTARAQEPGPAPAGEKILVYPIFGKITQRSCRVLRDTVEEYITERGVTSVIFQFDTGGGQLDPASETAEYIYSLDQRNIITVAYVPNNKDCFSAGALLAMSCRKIAMGDNCHFGDIEPRWVSGFTNEEAPEKIQTVVRSRVASYADKRSYPRVLAEAMVSKDIQVFQVTIMDRNGDVEKRFYSAAELEALPESTLNSITDRKVVVRSGHLLTLNEEEAYEYGFSIGVFTTRAALLERLGLTGEVLDLTEKKPLDLGWLAFLNHPITKFLLIVCGVLGFVLELKVPGFGLPGILGLICFVIFFGAGYFGNTVGAVEIVLFGLALALLAAEVFVIPGFGVAGVLGLAFLCLSLILGLIDGSGKFETSQLQSATLVVFCGLAASIVAIGVVLHYLPKTGAFAQSGLISTTVLDQAATPEAKDEHGYAADSPLLAKTGVVVSACRPAGKVEIDGKFHDVVAEGEFLIDGTFIEVARVEGHRIVVRPVTESSPGTE